MAMSDILASDGISDEDIFEKLDKHLELSELAMADIDKL